MLDCGNQITEAISTVPMHDALPSLLWHPYFLEIMRLRNTGLLRVPKIFNIFGVVGMLQILAGTLAGDGSRQPTELELAKALHQGKYFAGIAKKLKGSV